MHASSSSSGRGMPMPPPPPLPPTPHHHHHHFYHHHHQRHPEFRHATGVSTPAAAAATAAAAAAAAHAAAVDAATATDSGTAWDSENVAYVGMEYSNTGACSQRARASSLRRPGSSAGGCSQTKAAFSSLYSDERGLGGGYQSVTGFPLPSGGGFGTGTSASSSSSSSSAVLPVYSALPPTTPLPPPEALSSVPHEDFPTTAAVVPMTAEPCQFEGRASDALKVGGRYPGLLCDTHLRDGLQRAAHNDEIYETHGPSPSPEDITRPIDETTTKTDNVTTTTAAAAAITAPATPAATPAASELLDVKEEATTTAPPSLSGTKLELTPEAQQEDVDQAPMLDAAGAMEVADWPGTGHCEIPGCERSPRYGHGEGPPSVCQSHKKAGMFTVRDGKMMMATRDGSAFKSEEAPAAASTSTATAALKAECHGAADDTASIDAAAPDTAAAAAEAVAKSKVKRPAKRERAGSRCVDDDPAWTPSTASLRSQPMYRKLCEVAGCQVQPSYGPPGTTRPRFCCEHKSEGMIGLKNRRCLFPGCPTRPHYGLPNGRATYCAAHKKDGMLHLLKESKTVEKERVARSRELSRKTVAERKLMEAAKISSRYKTAFPSSSDGGGHGANNDADDYGDDDDDQEYGGGGEGGWTDDSEVEARKRRRASSSSPASSDKSEQRKGGCSTSGGPTGLSNDVIDDSGSGGNTGEKNKKPTSGDGVVGSRGVQGPCLTLGLGTLSWKSVASGWWSPGESEESDDEDVDNDDGNISGSSRRSRQADGSGMVPSVEMRLIRQARDSARAAAEASGSGRRARAPSRKLLEASGVLENEGAQWMTKEIKEADLKIKKELREQRKHFMAAGLKAGEVIEVVEVVEPLTAPHGIETGVTGVGVGGVAPGAAVARSRRADVGGAVITAAAATAAVAAAAADAAAATAEAGVGSRKKSGRATVLEAMSAFSRANRNLGAEVEDQSVPKARAWMVAPSEGGGGGGRSTSGGGSGGTGENAVVAENAIATAAETCAASGILPSGSTRDRESDNTGQDGEKTSSEAAGGTAGVEGGTRTAQDEEEGQGCVVDDGEARGGGGGGVSTCEFGECPRRASFGVNGTVRYCKSHRLFGMTEVPQSR